MDSWSNLWYHFLGPHHLQQSLLTSRVIYASSLSGMGKEVNESMPISFLFLDGKSIQRKVINKIQLLNFDIVNDCHEPHEPPTTKLYVKWTNGSILWYASQTGSSTCSLPIRTSWPLA